MNKLIFGDIEVSKKEFYEGKKAVNLGEVNETSKVFIGYMDDITGIVTSLYIILPQISGWTKYFDNCRKNMSFKIEDAVFI